MASSAREDLMKARKQLSDGGEPLFTRTREVNAEGRSSLKHGIPHEAVELLDLTADDSVEIEIFDDGYVVKKESDNDGRR